jgi:hypothetical protein
VEQRPFAAALNQAAEETLADVQIEQMQQAENIRQATIEPSHIESSPLPTSDDL